VSVSHMILIFNSSSFNTIYTNMFGNPLASSLYRVILVHVRSDCSSVRSEYKNEWVSFSLVHRHGRPLISDHKSSCYSSVLILCFSSSYVMKNEK
jgi:hypothetical protein